MPQASMLPTGISIQQVVPQLVAPRRNIRSTGPLQCLRHMFCASSAVLVDAAAAYSSSSQAKPANSITSDVTKASPLQQCLRLTYDLAARQAAKEGRQAVSADTAADIQRWVEYLSKRQETENGYWLYVLCGNWSKHPDGWTGSIHGVNFLWLSLCTVLCLH